MRFYNIKHQKFNLEFIKYNFGHELCDLVKTWTHLNLLNYLICFTESHILKI